MIEIKQHPFFVDIDWDLIERKGMVAPFVPVIVEGETDVSNIDEQFVRMGLEMTPVDKRFSEYFADQMQFDNFSYTHNDISKSV